MKFTVYCDRKWRNKRSIVRGRSGKIKINNDKNQREKGNEEIKDLNIYK